LPGVDIKKIKSCAQGQEGAALLETNISLAGDLKIMRGPTYLMDNQEIFGTNGIPSKEEFKKIFKR
jgi:protein-disulfide isomerase